MRFLNVKTNALRRNANNEFTLTCSSNRNALCDACAAFNECSKKLTKTHCSDFVPVLRFSVNAGLYDNTKIRNTIRVGQAWYKRLEIGQKIALWDGVQQKLTYALVESVHWDKDKSAFLEEHGSFNHMVVSGQIKHFDLEGLLRTQIGTGFYRNANGLTAVYFQTL